MDDQRDKLKAACSDLCARFNLDQAYFARILGPRRHYLAGSGAPAAARPRQLQVSPDIAFFWHGELHPVHRQQLEQAVKDIARDIQIMEAKDN